MLACVLPRLGALSVCAITLIRGYSETADPERVQHVRISGFMVFGLRLLWVRRLVSEALWNPVVQS